MLENIDKLEYQGKEIYLLKVAHVSNESKQSVEEAYNEIKPDTICIELDEKRYARLMDEQGWQNTNLVDVIKNNEAGILLANIVLGAYQRRVASKLGTNSGDEQREGIRIAKEHNLNLVLADRSINTTFSRIFHSLTLKEKVQMLMEIFATPFADDDISEEDIQNLMQKDVLGPLIAELQKSLPSVVRILVDERDMYLTEKIRTAPGKKILAIIGGGHAEGISRHLNEKIDLAELDKVEKKKSIVSWIFPLIIIALIAFTIIQNRDMGLQQIRSWLLWHGSLSAFGVLLALGHPLSILTAFIASPLTSLNPLLASGWFAGLVEAYVRKPKVRDLENIYDDVKTLKGFWTNRVTRTLMVVIFANVFSSIGTLISGIDIVRRFIESL